MSKHDKRALVKTVHEDGKGVVTRNIVFGDDWNVKQVTRHDAKKKTTWQEAFVGDYRVSVTYVRGVRGRSQIHRFTIDGWVSAPITPSRMFEPHEPLLQLWFENGADGSRELPAGYGWDGIRPNLAWGNYFAALALFNFLPLSENQELAFAAGDSPSTGCRYTANQMSGYYDPAVAWIKDGLLDVSTMTWYIMTKQRKVVVETMPLGMVGSDVIGMICLIKNAYLDADGVAYGIRWEIFGETYA